MTVEKEKVAKVINDFADEKYADSEEGLRDIFRQSVGDHLKDKLNLKNNPISVEQE